MVLFVPASLAGNVTARDFVLVCISSSNEVVS